MPVPYFHVVYTLPSKLRDIAYQNKRVVYDLLMKAAAETTLAIAANPSRLGARIDITAVLHTWGSTLTHHPHVHMIVPGGGLSLDGSRWLASRSNFLVHVNLLFSGKMLAMLTHAHDAGQLTFFNTHAGLADKNKFKCFIAPLRRIKWVVYCKAPFAGPKQVLRYLSRYTHRVAISNRRRIAAAAGIAFRWKDYRIDGPGRWKTIRLHPHEFIRRFLLHVLPRGFHRIRHYIAPLRRIKWVVYCKAPFAGPKRVLRYLSRYTHRVAISNRRLIAAAAGIAFRWKDYRIDGPGRWKTIRLHPHEFIRRFLLHVLPRGFHRIRHCGLFANANRAENIATVRAFLDVAPPAADPRQQPDIAPDAPRVLACPCPRCGARMIVIEVFASGCEPRWRPKPGRLDTS